MLQCRFYGDGTQQIIMFSLDQFIRPSVLQAINHKNEEKRKVGLAELERVIFIEAERSSSETVQNIAELFRQKYLKSSDINRKVIGLQVMMTILSTIQNNPKIAAKCEQPIVAIILECLIDNEAKVRALTFEKIFEIIQLFKEDCMRFFNQIFQKIIGCINDTEQAVTTACEFVDKKMKDLFHKNYEDREFDLGQLVSIIKAKIKTLNLQVRKYLIGWINQFLDLDLICYVGDVLQDLLLMISDMEIENDVYECLGNFQFAIKQKFDDNTLEQDVSITFINEIVTMLIKVAKSKSPSYTKLQSLQWFKLFFVFFRHQVEITVPKPTQKLYFKKIIIERFDEILEPILLLMSHEEEEVRRESIYVNQILKESIDKVEKEVPINIVKIVPLLKEALSEKKASMTSEAALNWMKFMLQIYEGKLIPGMMEIVVQVMEKIYEGTAKNINEIIEIMKSKEDYFQLMIQMMLQFLNTKVTEQEDKMEVMLKKFITPKDIDHLWTSVCKHIHSFHQQPLFMFEIAASLNSIIVHQENMRELRKLIQQWQNPEYPSYFHRMFQILKYNPPAAISLCLLSNQFQLALHIVTTLTGKKEISPKVLLGLSRLVGQLESPAFASLRMRMLQCPDFYLLESLNYLLMMLPQGKIFNMLKSRLEFVELMDKENRLGPPCQSVPNPLQIEVLFQEYQMVGSCLF